MSSRTDPAIWSGLFRISPDSGQTLQAQIRQAIVAAILDRQIAASMPLPSCRVLAEKLGVARGTVVLAFQQLVDQGFLIARERRGHFVNPEILAAPAGLRKVATKSPKESIDWKARRRVFASDMPEPTKQENWIKASYPFVYGQFDPALFPTAEWRECNRMALAVLEIRNWAADMVDRDDPLLIEQIQARLLPRRGIFANPDEIIVTLGAQNALYMLATLLMGKGTKVAMENPGYPDARSIFRLAGAEVAPVPVDREGIDPTAIPRDSDFVFVTPNHHCPSMVALSDERRRFLLDDAERNDRIIIEDGYDSQLMDEAPQQALRSMDRSGRVIYVGSLSKTLAPGLRLGFIVASAGLVAELRALRRFMLRHPPANNQRAVALFLSLGHHEALVRRLSTAFAERRRRLAQAVGAYLPEWQATNAPSGTSVWLEGPRGANAHALAEVARSRGVLIEPGARFFDKPEQNQNYIRLGISSIALQHIEPGIRELATAAGRRPAAA
ncbi:MULTISPECIES: PLP-dependent aminotransferase family protein [unclassified Aminobacter]|uniref:MocR-like pyridoxine biosynthesis transcription factor PdxR n=1 Tax=unclassified Aminobacter TaxID=2644704 RepID=UPI0004632696|nr:MULTISPECIES: PLP-dependent aminotransferase family protein [unclassified Aminobacter]TWG55195.1 GntR family transcriptional regulator/MocR family aminotransferase [Aminobacter sp. J44]TWH27080.1 GntR family transcriptional regulator/MocR family aminotransferase [Aminobacter sp. J15]